jgi:hypothetical protein
MYDTPTTDPEIEALAETAADQVMLALDVSCERNGFGVFELDRASHDDPRTWLYAFPGALTHVALPDFGTRPEWRGEPVYYISNTPPNVFRAERLTDAGSIGKALALHISQREDGCGIPSVTRDEALLAVIGSKTRTASR